MTNQENKGWDLVKLVLELILLTGEILKTIFS